MDLSQFTVDPENQTATLEIVHPGTGQVLRDEDGVAVTITLHGPDSKAVKSVERAWTNKRLAEGMRSKKATVSIEQIEDQAMAVDVAATVDWSGVAFDGEELECTPENIRKVYTRLPWIREQVEEFFNERANFLGK